MENENQSRLDLLRKLRQQSLYRRQKLESDVETWKELVKDGSATWAYAVAVIQNDYGLSIRCLNDIGVVGLFKQAQKQREQSQTAQQGE
jgi:hypothetical protein